MKESKYAKEKREKLVARSIELYKTGLSNRDVAKLVGRSYQWVWLQTKHLMNDEQI